MIEEMLHLVCHHIHIIQIKAGRNPSGYKVIFKFWIMQTSFKVKLCYGRSQLVRE